MAWARGERQACSMMHIGPTVLPKLAMIIVTVALALQLWNAIKSAEK